MKKADIDINNLPPVNKRLYEFAIKSAGSIYAFSKNIELSQPRINSLFHVSGPTGKYPVIQSDILEAILNKYDLDINWLFTGHGSMLKNISENSENLLKQSKKEDRYNSIDEIINQRFEELIMEHLDRMVDTVMKRMNQQIDLQNKHMREVLKIQSDDNVQNFKVLVDAIKEIVKEEDIEKFERKIIPLKAKLEDNGNKRRGSY